MCVSDFVCVGMCCACMCPLFHYATGVWYNISLTYTALVELVDNNNFHLGRLISSVNFDPMVTSIISGLAI